MSHLFHLHLRLFVLDGDLEVVSIVLCADWSRRLSIKLDIVK